jgi:hypothetical protein
VEVWGHPYDLDWLELLADEKESNRGIKKYRKNEKNSGER